MSEMIDRVSAAICGKCLGNPEAMARAAIEAMLEPTAWMLENGCADFPNAATPYRRDEYSPAAKQIYESMINAALTPDPG